MLWVCLLTLFHFSISPIHPVSPQELLSQNAPDWMLWDAFFIHLVIVDKMSLSGARSKANLGARIGIQPSDVDALITLAKSYYQARASLWRERKLLLAQSLPPNSRLKQLEQQELELAYHYSSKLRSAVPHKVYLMILSWIDRDVAPRVVPFNLPKH